jgi:hypothetical protein
VTFTHSADCGNPVCPEPHGIWTTTQPPRLEDFESARSLLEEAASRGETVCWVGGQRWTWVAVPELHSGRQPAIDADLLGRAIREHRQAEFDPHATISMTHLCFDDCAEDIASRYDDLAAR